MTYADVKDWVDANLLPRMVAFGVQHWRITVEYTRHDRAEDGFQTIVNVSRRPEYERATIRFDCDFVDDLDQLAEHLDHELLHIVHAPFHIFYRLVWEMVPASKRAVLNEAYNHAEEMTVRNLERMAHGLCETASRKDGKDA